MARGSTTRAEKIEQRCHLARILRSATRLTFACAPTTPTTASRTTASSRSRTGCLACALSRATNFSRGCQTPTRPRPSGRASTKGSQGQAKFPTRFFSMHPIRMHIYTHAYTTYTFLYTCIPIQHIHTYTHAYLYTCIHIHMHIYTVHVLHAYLFMYAGSTKVEPESPLLAKTPSCHLLAALRPACLLIHLLQKQNTCALLGVPLAESPVLSAARPALSRKPALLCTWPVIAKRPRYCTSARVIAKTGEWRYCSPAALSQKSRVNAPPTRDDAESALTRPRCRYRKNPAITHPPARVNAKISVNGACRVIAKPGVNAPPGPR